MGALIVDFVFHERLTLIRSFHIHCRRAPREKGRVLQKFDCIYFIKL